MAKLSEKNKKFSAPTVVAQFGEGNFLRAFADQMIDVANEKGVFSGGVAVIKPIAHGSLDALCAQDCAYTVILRGKADGKEVVDHRAVSVINQAIDPFVDYDAYLALARLDTLRFVISNTTEAGIVFDGNDSFDQLPAGTFPGKLTQFLLARFGHFKGDKSKGLIVLPAELIEQNGTKLKECIRQYITLWKLSPDFALWVEEACIFCNTLVDRIVSGYPAQEAATLQKDLLGYEDDFIVVGEPFGFWAIESPQFAQVQKEFPLDQAGLPVVFTENLKPYRDRKVRILNGAHTASVLAAFLCGLDTVFEMMEHPTCRAFLEKTIFEEIFPTVQLPAQEVTSFSNSVIERFENPFLHHELLSISLNSVSKWKARILPSLQDNFANNGVLPTCLAFSLAALATFYRSAQQVEDAALVGTRAAGTYPIRDDAHVLAFFKAHAALPDEEFAQALLAREDFWGQDLSKLGNFSSLLTQHLQKISQLGMEAAIASIVS